MSVLVVPLLLALGAGVAPWIVGLIYLLLSAGYQAALGDAVWITIRLFPTIGMLALLAALLGRAPRAPVAPRGPIEAPA
jgi:hypothetical protein